MASTLLLVVVFVFDLIAFALAVAAEQRRNTELALLVVVFLKMGLPKAAKFVVFTIWAFEATVLLGVDYNYCHYDSDIATGLGVGSLLFLLASQILIMAASRCLCCGKAMRPSRSRTWAIVLFITCWVFFFIAEVCLLAGSVRNAYHTKYYPSNSSKTCRTLRKGIFGAGAAFIVFTGIVSELYYVSYSKANDGQPPYARDTGVRMGNL